MTAAFPEPPLVARLRAAGCVFAEDEAVLLTSAATSAADLERLVALRETGVPLEHVLGWVEFRGRRYEVDPGVFVPRRRTEYLVAQAVARCRADAVVVDLCCGCGAIGASIAAAHPGITVWATDIDPAAVACARRNLAGIGEVRQGDLDAPLPAELRGRVDVLVANVPYVPTWALPHLPPEARLYEQRVALDGGADGLDVLRRMASVAPGWLAPHGHLLAEADERQADAALAVLADAGLEPSFYAAEETNTTVVIGRRP